MVDQVKEPQNDISNGKVLSGSPGIVVLTPSLQILHMNDQAQILISDMVPSTTPAAQQPNNRTEILPPALITLSREIIKVLRRRHERSEEGQFEIRYVADESGKPVFIRGMGVPNRGGIGHARISERAYAWYEEHGRADGHALEDWLAAERQVLNQS